MWKGGQNTGATLDPCIRQWSFLDIPVWRERDSASMLFVRCCLSFNYVYCVMCTWVWWPRGQKGSVCPGARVPTMTSSPTWLMETKLGSSAEQSTLMTKPSLQPRFLSFMWRHKTSHKYRECLRPQSTSTSLMHKIPDSVLITHSIK